MPPCVCFNMNMLVNQTHSYSYNREWAHICDMSQSCVPTAQIPSYPHVRWELREGIIVEMRKHLPSTVAYEKT